MNRDFIKVATPTVDENEVDAVREVLLDGQYVSGKRVQEFEDQFADYIGVRHAVAVSSGTAALYIALEAMGVGPGDEVIVPPLTFFATVSAVLYLQAKPVFADIDLDDLCLSPESTETKISARTKAIIPVHLFGNSAKMDAFKKISDKFDIAILEDCAQAHGTEYGGCKVGSMGKAGAFSFFATKHMTTGEGGIVTTDDQEVAETIKIIRNHGMQGRDTHERLGYNNRMTEMEAAIGLIQLKKLNRLNNLRIANSEFLLEQINKLSWAMTPSRDENVKHTYFWCPLMVAETYHKDIDDLKEHLNQNRIGFRHRYQEPLYKQPVLQRLGVDTPDLFLPNVERVAGKIIGLPNHPGLTRSDLDTIVKVLASF